MHDDAARRMDRMYRHQRHIYDLTRKFYLLGRDDLLADLALRPGSTACEIGCGTARNLVALARRYPGVRLFGIDASAEMLATAAANVARAGLADRIVLRQGLAEALDPAATFGLERPFDTVILSFVLSMIPPWQEAAARALACVAPSGTVAIVDFGDQAGLPRWFRAALKRWLALFDVTPRPDLLTHLRDVAAREHGSFASAEVFGGYSRLVWIRRTAPPGLSAWAPARR